jgi:WD40 repeat protein
MKRLLTATLLTLITAGTIHAEEAITPVDPELGREVDFYQDVYPILEAKCLACHSSIVKEGGLNLESAEQIMKGGNSGEAVDPGDAEFSYLYLVASRESEPAMPPIPNKAQAKPLTPRELGILQQWINEGAKGGQRQVDASISWQPIPETYKAVYSLAMTPNTQFIAAGRGNRIFLYDLVSKQEVARLTDPSLQSLQDEAGQALYGPGVAHRDFVHALAVSPDGRRFASGGYRVVKLWERQSAANLGEFELPEAVRVWTIDGSGRWGAFVLENNEVRLWNLTNGNAGPVIPAGEAKVTAVGFSADADQLVIGDESGLVRLVQTADGEPAGELTTPAAVTSLAVRAQGPELLTGHGDNLIRAWNWPASGESESPDNDEQSEDEEEAKEEKDNEEADKPAAPEPVREFKGHGGAVTQLRVLEEKNELLSGSADQTVRLWNLDDAKEAFNQNLGGAVTSIDISEDGEWIVAGGENQLARIWKRGGEAAGDLKGNLELARSEVTRTDDVEVAKSRFQLADQAFQDAEKDLEQREESLTKAKEQQEEAKKGLAEPEKKFNEAQAKAEEAKKALDENEDEDQEENLKKAKEEADKALAEAKEELDKAKDALASAERAVKLSEQSVQTSKENVERRKAARETAEAEQKQAEEALEAIKEQVAQSNRPIRSVAILPERSLVLTAGQEQPVQAWNLQTGAPVELLDIPAEAITRLAVSSTGAVVTLTEQNQAGMWDVTPRWSLAGVLGPQSGSPLDVSESVLTDRVTALAFSPDGEILATGGGEPSRNGELMLWDVSERSLVREIEEAHSDTIFDIDFSRDGTFLVSGGADKFVKVFRVEDGSFVRSFEGHTDHVLGVAFKADGSSLASSGSDNAIKIWNTETGEQRRTISNYSKQVTSVQFIGVTENLVSSSGDKSVKFHRAGNGQNYRTFGGGEDFMYAALATRDESLVIAAGEDGTVRVWDGSNGQVIATFEAPQPAEETAQR